MSPEAQALWRALRTKEEEKTVTVKKFSTVPVRLLGKLMEQTGSQCWGGGGEVVTAKDTSIRATMLRHSSKENASPGGPERESRKD